MKGINIPAAGAQAFSGNDIARLKRNLGESEKQMLEKALAAASSAAPFANSHHCEGDVYVGLFFDGTGNNIKDDFGEESSPLLFLKRHPSNIARLYLAFPSEDDKNPQRFTAKAGCTDRIYRFYVPGVGTPFPEVGDDGKGLWDKIMASAAGANGAVRILWGLAQVINAAYFFLTKQNLISSEDVQDYDEDDLKEEFAEKIEELKNKNRSAQPSVRAIHLYVFGFSRGAAETRAFSNWLLEISDEAETGAPTEALRQFGGTIHLAGIPLNFRFMGLFDTVASVGSAEIWPTLDGHSSWADRCLEVPAYVKKCVHLVAGNEIRACFPLDSIRKNDRYEGNVEEIVCPGAHSDLGGGYSLGNYGKFDYDPGSEYDFQIARAYGFDMYLRALEAGVPFYTLEQLKQFRQPLQTIIPQSLKPQPFMLDELAGFVKESKVSSVPVEKQIFEHTALYLGWRWSQGFEYFLTPGANKEIVKQIDKEIEDAEDILSDMIGKRKSLNGETMFSMGKIGPYGERDWINKVIVKQQYLIAYLKSCREKANFYMGKGNSEEIARLTSNQRVLALQTGKADTYKKQQAYLERTQRTIIQVVGAYCGQIDQRLIAENKLNPKDKIKSFYSWATGGDDDVPEDSESLKNPFADIFEESDLLLLPLPRSVQLAVLSGKVQERLAYLKLKFFTNSYFAMQAPEFLKRWYRRKYFIEKTKENAPERDGVWLLEGIAAWNALDEKSKSVLGRFFAKHVHDSEAGFYDSYVYEFELNGYGLAKYRNVFTGDSGDSFIRTVVENINKEREAEVRLRFM